MPEQDSSGRGEVAAAGGSGSIQTPMPGLIVEVMVKPDEEVTAGTTLVILEAMKMENAVKAPFDGVVKSVNVAKGDQANMGDVLVELEALE
jgi:pyruvate carboxylase subunit B